MEYRNQGILPEALLNYLVRLGWSHGDEELFTLDEMVELFDIRDVNKAASAFNTEKLLWINQHYIKQADPARIARLLSPHMGNLDIDPAEGPDLVDVVRQQQERAKTLVEMADISAFFYRDFEEFDQKAAKKHLKAAAREPLQQVRDRLKDLNGWVGEELHQVVIDVAEALSLNMGKVAQPLRVAVVGRAASPGIDVTLELVGREACLRRIDKALAWINKRVDENGS
jgi:glutamyl-tRNA synthetase